MKNSVYMIATPSNGVIKREYQYSIESWKMWCSKNDAQFFLLEEPMVDVRHMHIIWQRYFMFELFDSNEVKSDQTLIVDADTIVHPECPNFFNETDGKYCLIHDDGSYDWILRGMEHYSKYVFDGMWFPFWEYGNSGFQIVNNTHRIFFKAMQDFYLENINAIQSIQHRYGIGTDQTPLNFMLKRHSIDVKLLPYKYNMICMNEKEILDDNLSFLPFGWVYHFNGLPNKNETVPYYMEKTYKRLYG